MKFYVIQLAPTNRFGIGFCLSSHKTAELAKKKAESLNAKHPQCKAMGRDYIAVSSVAKLPIAYIVNKPVKFLK